MVDGVLLRTAADTGLALVLPKGGHYYLALSKSGYLTDTNTVWIGGGEVLEFEVVMVISGIMMSEVHGVDLLRQIKQVVPDVKAIMITAVDDEDIARGAMEQGAVDFVIKPLDLNYLDALVTF